MLEFWRESTSQKRNQLAATAIPCSTKVCSCLAPTGKHGQDYLPPTGNLIFSMINLISYVWLYSSYVLFSKGEENLYSRILWICNRINRNGNEEVGPSLPNSPWRFFPYWYELLRFNYCNF